MARSRLHWVLLFVASGVACSDSSTSDHASPRNSAGTFSQPPSSADASISEPIDNGAGSFAPSTAGSSAASGAGAPESCAQAEYAAKLHPLDMLIVLDQSGSMTEHEDKWTPVTEALKSFVSSGEAAGMGVALQYFPLGDDEDEKCEPNSYAKLDVPMGTLPDNAKPMIDSIDAHYFDKANCCDLPQHQGTPTRPAVQGAIKYLQEWLKQHGDHTGAILLATDGEPSECDDNDIDDVAAVISDAAKASPAVSTYVVGIGDQEDLDDLAAGGGTGLGAILVDGSGKNTQRELLDALAKIRAEALSCEFGLPEGSGADPNNVAIELTRSPGPATSLGRVTSKDACAKTQAPAFYSTTGSAPSLALCPDTCATTTSSPDSRLRILVGCQAPILL